MMNFLAIRTMARLIRSHALGLLAEARINVTKPFKYRKLKRDPVHTLKRRIYKMETRDPKIKRKRSLYKKIYTRKNKQLLKKRHEFVKKAKERLPPPPGKIETKRHSG